MVAICEKPEKLKKSTEDLIVFQNIFVFPFKIEMDPLFSSTQSLQNRMEIIIALKNNKYTGILMTVDPRKECVNIRFRQIP